MATLQSVLDFARAQCQTDSNGLTDANGIIFANEALVDFHRKLVNKGIDASQLQECFVSLNAPTSGNGQTATYPSDCLALKTIEVNFVDTSIDNLIRAEQVDVSNLGGRNSFSYLRANQPTNAPAFDDRGDWYEIFPALECYVRLFYYLKPTEYTATSDTVAYPESQDYRILGWRIASNYYYALEKFNEGDKMNTRYEERVAEYTSTLGRGSSQPIQSQVLNVGSNGWAF